jgi:protoporphyrinogen oxidase
VAAYRLRKSGVKVTVFEADDRAGGKIRTNSDSGFLWDEGANTMVSPLSVVNLEPEFVEYCAAVLLYASEFVLWH